MLDFKGILMTDIIYSFCMYLVCYKILILLANSCFSCYCMHYDNYTMYTSRCRCRFWITLKMICP